MIACFLARDIPAEDLADRIASSLGLFGGGSSAVCREGQAIFAQVPARDQAASAEPGMGAGVGLRTTARTGTRRSRGADRARAAGHPAWSPARSGSGAIILLSGTIDNDDELRAALGTRLRDPAALYGEALERWGDEADRRVVGAYSSIVFEPERRALRLARSPWTAPPLHYFDGVEGTGAASVLRVLHLCGLERRLNRRKLADSMFNNLTEPEGWYEGGFEVQLGTIVRLAGGTVTRSAYYDHLAPREPIRMRRPADYVEAAGALLDEAVARALRGARKPAVQLSGGLDSSNVTARVLKALPAGQPLNSYTFVPHPDFDEPVPANFYASERHKVEDMAALHPRLIPRFCDNRDTDYDDCFDQLFLATGMAPDPMPNIAPLLGVYAAARDDGCDVMIGAGKGNFNISQSGQWGFVEYLARGRWVQLYRALSNTREKTCGLPRRLFSWSIKPLLPLSVQRAINGRSGGSILPAAYDLTPIRPEFRRAHAMEERAKGAGLLEERPFRTSRALTMRDMFARGEMNSGDVVLGLEQIFGMPYRDVTAYRPLMEFCHALPTDCFLRDGQERWLARELGREGLPDSIRLERRAGMPQPDWHLRLKRRLPAIRAELAQAESDPVLAEIVDFGEVRRRLERFPQAASHTTQDVLNYSMTLPRLAMAARFSRFVSGRNAG